MARRTNDAPTRESPDLVCERHPPAGHYRWPALVATHMHPSVVKEPGDGPPTHQTPIAPPGVVRAGGAISLPHGERSWARDLTVPDRSLPPARGCSLRTPPSA